MLMTHTADFINHTYNRLSQEKGQPVITASKVCLMTPLLFDPGERWDCGTNLDWCGQIVEAITDQRLGDIFKTRIFEPIGIQDMTFELTDAMRQRLAGIHAKGADGSLTPMDFELPAKPEVHMGGHGLYGTVGDYLRFIRMWSNDGAGKHGRMRKAETVRMAEKNHFVTRRCADYRYLPVAVQRRRVFFGCIKILGAELHDQRRRRTHWVSPVRSVGRALPICSIGLIARTGSAGSGRPRFFPSAIRRRSSVT